MGEKSFSDLNSRRRFNKDTVSIYMMLFPSFFLFVCISVYPFMWAVRYVFYSYDGLTKPYFLGFENFVRAFTRDKILWKGVINTFEYAIRKLLFIIPLALITAVLLNKNTKFKDIFRILFFVPTVISSAIAALIFYFIYSPYNGVLNSLLSAIGLIKSPIDWLGNVSLVMGSIVVLAVWSGFGNYMILFLAGLQSIPDELNESATLDGASAFQHFFNITLPLLGPITKVILLLAITTALKDYQTIMVMTNGGPLDRTQVMYLYVYHLMFGSGGLGPSTGGTRLQYGYGATVGLISSVISGIITIIYLKYSKKMDEIY